MIHTTPQMHDFKQLANRFRIVRPDMAVPWIAAVLWLCLAVSCEPRSTEAEPVRDAGAPSVSPEGVAEPENDDAIPKLITGENLLENGSFETGPSGRAYHWRSTTDQSDMRPDDSIAAAEGTQSLRITFVENRSVRIYQNVPGTKLEPYAQYVLSGSLKTAGVKGRVRLAVEAKHGSKDDFAAHTVSVSDSNDWTSVHVKFRAPPSLPNISVYAFYTPAPLEDDTGGVAWIDDLALRRVIETETESTPGSPQETESAAVAEACPAPQTTGRKPNVIWILLDAARASNFSCYGYDRETSPNIDKIAQRGVVFEQNFSNAQGTTLSVPSFLSGRYFPIACMDQPGSDWKYRFRQPAAGELLLPEFMGKQGYCTALFSAASWITPHSRLWKTFHHAEPIARIVKRGPVNPYPDFNDLNQAILPWLDAHHDRSFFLYVHSLDTHYPHFLEPPYDLWADSNNTRDFSFVDGTSVVEGLTEADRQHLRGLYDGSIRFADDAVGRIVDKLSDLKILDNTIIVIASDHGELLGEDGKTVQHPVRTSYEELMHVPLIMAGPGIPADVRIPSLTQNVDIVPTLTELLGLPNTMLVDGKSTVSLMKDPSASPIHPFVFVRLARDESYESAPIYVARTDEYKFEWDPVTDTEHLYEIPDPIQSRRDVLDQHPGVAKSLRQRLLDEVVPMWDQYQALPIRNVDADFILYIPPDAEPGNAFVHTSQGTARDNLWQLGSGAGLASNGVTEDAPPITFELSLPNGEFLVQAEVLVELDRFGSTASSFLYRAQSDEAFKLLDDHLDVFKPGFRFVDLGTYHVTGNTFRLTLDDVRTHWAILKRLRFIPVGILDSAEEVRDLEDRSDSLRSLGYL